MSKTVFRLSDKDLEDAVIGVALLQLSTKHSVHPDLYSYIEERQLGPRCIEEAEKMGNKALIDDAIAQWG